MNYVIVYVNINSDREDVPLRVFGPTTLPAAQQRIIRLEKNKAPGALYVVVEVEPMDHEMPS